MLIVLSPAKTLNMEAEVPSDFFTIPQHLEKSQKLIEILKKKTTIKLEELMGISTQLAQLNYERFQQWHIPYTPEEAKQSIFAFRGDVYTGLNIDTFTTDQLEYMQNHIRILSGLYGTLKPMDLILAYRLEMGTQISVGRKKNLYAFWDRIITNDIKEAVSAQNDDILINLASNEYFKSIDKTKLGATIITPVFKDLKNGQYKLISFFAKKARGMMSRFILQNKLNKVEDIKHFEEDGYFYNDKLSTETSPTFTRG